MKEAACAVPYSGERSDALRLDSRAGRLQMELGGEINSEKKTKGLPQKDSEPPLTSAKKSTKSEGAFLCKLQQQRWGKKKKRGSLEPGRPGRESSHSNEGLLQRKS